MILALVFAAATLPHAAQCAAVVNDPEAAWAHSVALQGYIYGYPIVDLLAQKHNETHRVSPHQPIAAGINELSIYPHLLTPSTQGQLRAPNADTLYLNAWLDLSKGPVILSIPEMGKRYYTLAFMDLYAKPIHLGTRTNAGEAKRYALVGPSGGTVPDAMEAIHLATDTVWMLGRVLVDGQADLQQAITLSRAIRFAGDASQTPLQPAEPMQPMASLDFFAMLNSAFKSLPKQQSEAGLMALFDAAGFGPSAGFDRANLSSSTRLGMECALAVGPRVIAERAYRPRRVTNGWSYSAEMANPGHNYLLRATVARGGYVNAPEETIYMAAVADDSGQQFDGARQYRIRFPKGALPPVDAFWSITPYDMQTLQLTENPIRRYQVGDRTQGLRFDTDGSLTLILSATQPKQGQRNWLPTPKGAYHLVTRLYLPHASVVNGEYSLPPVERMD